MQSIDTDTLFQTDHNLSADAARNFDYACTALLLILDTSEVNAPVVTKLSKVWQCSQHSHYNGRQPNHQILA